MSKRDGLVSWRTKAEEAFETLFFVAATTLVLSSVIAMCVQ